MTGSFSKSTSFQQDNAQITQQYAGTCNVSCDNTITGVNIDLIDSILSGGINITQECSVDAQCLFNITQNSLADTLFKASNSSSAAGGILPGVSVSVNSSYQDISESILQSIQETCNINSSNDISNVSVYAQSSTIGGGVNITQQNSTNGSCTFNTLMTATEMATGTSDNCSASGKMAKKSCAGKGGGVSSILVYGGVAVLLFIGVMMIYKAFRNSSTPGGTPGSPGGGTSSGTPSATSLATSLALKSASA